jgi:hypothetical protein
VSYSLEYSDQRSNPQLLHDMATISAGRFGPPATAAFDPSPQVVGSVREIGLPLLWLALLLWPFDIATRRLMLRASDIAPWLARRRTSTPATAPTLTRLSAAKQRAGTSMARAAAPPQDIAAPQPTVAQPLVIADPPTPPIAATAPSQPATPTTDPTATTDTEDRFARLMAAKQRARREKK